MSTPLYLPREIEVSADSCGVPEVIVRKGRQNRIAAISNIWRIDDDWWRDEISRMYFEVELRNGQVMTIFHDLASGKWYQQRY
jgi:hypothetical protein